MTEVLSNLFWLLIFPGFLFTVAVGLLAAWIVRKVTARIHHRIGPPILQPLYDVIKLLGKETLIPEAAQTVIFFAAPIIGFAAVLVLSVMLGMNAFLPGRDYLGDVIAVIYLMVIPSLALILGGSSSASPHAAIGTSREMKLVMAYEFPLILALIVVLLKAATLSGLAEAVSKGGILNLSTLSQSAPVLSISGLLAFLVSLLCIHAKLGYTPFDMAEAETELAGGLLIEYSGALLALWKLMQAMLLVALPLFLVLVFLGGFGSTLLSFITGALKYVMILALLILIKNTNPRMRIDQTMKFFWFYCGPALAVAVVLAGVGYYYQIPWL